MGSQNNVSNETCELGQNIAGPYEQVVDTSAIRCESDAALSMFSELATAAENMHAFVCSIEAVCCKTPSLFFCPPVSSLLRVAEHFLLTPMKDPQLALSCDPHRWHFK